LNCSTIFLQQHFILVVLCHIREQNGALDVSTPGYWNTLVTIVLKKIGALHTHHSLLTLTPFPTKTTQHTSSPIMVVFSHPWSLIQIQIRNRHKIEALQIQMGSYSSQRCSKESGEGKGKGKRMDCCLKKKAQ